jgi:hypothetical protein
MTLDEAFETGFRACEWGEYRGPGVADGWTTCISLGRSKMCRPCQAFDFIRTELRNEGFRVRNLERDLREAREENELHRLHKDQMDATLLRYREALERIASRATDSAGGLSPEATLLGDIARRALEEK